MNHARMITISALIIILVFLFVVSYRVLIRAPIIEKERLLMGTIVRIKAPIGFGRSAKRVSEAIDKAFNEMTRVESVFSIYKADSEISRINRLKRNETLKISGEVFELVSKSIEFCDKTKGAFDITVKPLIDVWANAKSTGKVPSDDEVEAAMKKIGSAYVKMDRADGTISFCKDDMALDLGGVAKGYAVDRAVKILIQNGVRNAVVHIGGDMYCLGSKSRSRRWRVGIQHPRDRQAIVFDLEVSDKSVDTSGDYERYFMAGSKRYSHIIDPRRGVSIGDDVVSVTVIADDSTTGDMYSTALCVLGAHGLKLAESAGIDAVIMTKRGDHFDIEMTKGFLDRYDVEEKSKL